MSDQIAAMRERVAAIKAATSEAMRRRRLPKDDPDHTPTLGYEPIQRMAELVDLMPEFLDHVEQMIGAPHA